MQHPLSHTIVRYPRDPTLDPRLGFFGPYCDLSFEEKVDFYRHAGRWTNRMILGDSLLVMTSLAASRQV